MQLAAMRVDCVRFVCAESVWRRKRDLIGENITGLAERQEVCLAVLSNAQPSGILPVSMFAQNIICKTHPTTAYCIKIAARKR